jgi:hypothetical protein
MEKNIQIVEREFKMQDRMERGRRGEGGAGAGGGGGQLPNGRCGDK